jgi:DNA-binding winged helix-turn-helix (wHTH) protein
LRFRTPSFEFDAATGEVHRDGTVHRLEPQPSALLALLMSRPGELVPRADAIRALWGDHTTVNFQEGLDYSLRQVRIALSDRARPARYVETIPRRGYRFVAPVERPGRTVDRQRPSRRHMWTAAALAAVLLVAGATALLERRPNRHHAIAVSVLRAVHDRLF